MEKVAIGFLLGFIVGAISAYKWLMREPEAGGSINAPPSFFQNASKKRTPKINDDSKALHREIERSRWS